MQLLLRIRRSARSSTTAQGDKAANETKVSLIAVLLFVSMFVHGKQNDYRQIVSKQLHDRSAVLVRLVVQSIKLGNCVIECLGASAASDEI
jgi:hypothetical protein